MMKTMLIKKPAYAEFAVSEGEIMYMEKATNAKNQNASKNVSKNGMNVMSTNGLNQPLLTRNQQNTANSIYVSTNTKPVEGGARKHKTKKARASRPKKCMCKTQSRKHKHPRH